MQAADVTHSPEWFVDLKLYSIKVNHCFEESRSCQDTRRSKRNWFDDWFINMASMERLVWSSFPL